jgi:hypothetical protein
MSLVSATASASTTSFGGADTFSRTSSSGYDAIKLSARQQQYPKCKEKDALCKAMGALFLQHRVDKLQSDVDKLEKKESGGCPWKTSWKRSGCQKQKGMKIDERQEIYYKDVKKAEGTKADFVVQQSISRVSDQQAKKIIVVDVSLLIYSLRTIHNWLKEGDCRVVVPIESLRTLDLLKKGDHYLNLAARKATRFLDERFVSASTSVDQKLAPGLVPQREDERLNCSHFREVISLFGPPTTVDLNINAEQLPHTIRETMACTLFFIREYTLSPPSTSTPTPPSISLGLALPPPHFDCSEDLQGTLRNAQRADGSDLLQLARQLGLGDASSSIGDRLIVAPTAASWLTADAGGKEACKSRDGDANG